jgi:hypothetical protein
MSGLIFARLERVISRFDFLDEAEENK